MTALQVIIILWGILSVILTFIRCKKLNIPFTLAKATISETTGFFAAIYTIILYIVNIIG